MPSIFNNIKNDVSDFGQGVFNGTDTYATPLLKASNQIFGLGLDPAAIQSTYNSNVNNYNQAAQRSPIAANAGNLTGNMIATAPLFAAGGSGLAANTIRGGIMGGLAAHQGQDPNEIINSPSQAVTGAAIGLGSSAVANGLTNLVTKGADQVANLLGWNPTSSISNSGTLDLNHLVSNAPSDVTNQSVSQSKNTLAITGLNTILNHGGAGAAIGGSIGGAIGGYEGSKVGVGIGAGLQISNQALGSILGSPALKSVLSNISSVDSSLFQNPEYVQFATDRVGQLLSNAGINLHTSPNTPPTLMHQDEIKEKQNDVYSSFNDPQLSYKPGHAASDQQSNPYSSIDMSK